MAYFPDLSPYTYSGPESATLSIGWLAKEYPFSTGVVAPIIIERVIQLAETPVNAFYFGSHGCELCMTAGGTGEIRVAGLNGTLYAAPTLIGHYIHAHHYLPPEAFIRALVTTPIIHGRIAHPQPYRTRVSVPPHPWDALTPRFLITRVRMFEMMQDPRWNAMRADSPFGVLREDSQYYDGVAMAMVELLLDPTYAIWEHLRELHTTPLEVLVQAAIAESHADTTVRGA